MTDIFSGSPEEPLAPEWNYNPYLVPGWRYNNAVEVTKPKVTQIMIGALASSNGDPESAHRGSHSAEPSHNGNGSHPTPEHHDDLPSERYGHPIEFTPPEDTRKMIPHALGSFIGLPPGGGRTKESTLGNGHSAEPSEPPVMHTPNGDGNGAHQPQPGEGVSQTV